MAGMRVPIRLSRESVTNTTVKVSVSAKKSQIITVPGDGPSIAMAENVTATIGSNVTLECNVTSIAPVAVHWIHRGQELMLERFQ